MSMRSLRFRLIASYMSLALILLLATGLIFSSALLDYAERVRQQRLNDRVRQAQAVADASTGTPDELLGRLQSQFPDLEWVVITQSVTVSVTGSPPPGTANPDATPQPRIFTFRSGSPDGTNVLTHGNFTVKVQEKASGGRSFLAIYKEVALIVAMGLGLALLLGWWFSHWLSRPVAQLTKATAAVAEGDFLHTVAPTGTPELDGLVQQFNRMAQRLDQSFRSLGAERDMARRFASDAAHELRTPLTALKAYHETVAKRPERLPQVLPGLGRSIDRVEGIISGLLQLSRLSEGTGIELAEGDAAAVVRVLEPSLRLLARDAGHSFATAGLEQTLPVRLDPRLLEIALFNLVENACKFTAPGGTIRLELSRTPAEAVIAVADTGPGIPAAEQERIFERFHRGTDTQSIPGSGLGLSIVKEAVGRLGGRVGVESQVGQGSRFCIHLPTDSPGRC